MAEARLQTLTNTLIATDRCENAKCYRTEIRAVNLALGHYRTALEMWSGYQDIRLCRENQSAFGDSPCSLRLSMTMTHGGGSCPNCILL